MRDGTRHDSGYARPPIIEHGQNATRSWPIPFQVSCPRIGAMAGLQTQPSPSTCRAAYYETGHDLIISYEPVAGLLHHEQQASGEDGLGEG